MMTAALQLGRVVGAGVLLALVCLPVAAAAPGGQSVAAPRREGAIPSCYEQLREHAPAEVASDLTVVIDQTTAFDARLQQIVLESVERLIEPGTRVSVVAFSAFLQGRYLDVLVSGQVEGRIAGKRRDYVPKRHLIQSEQCLDEQLPFARRLVVKSLRTAFARSDPSLARSDILTALHDLSRRVGESPAERRLVLVVSDMLENSAITSFYQAGRLRRIDPAAELKRVADSGIHGDFQGAQVYVVGAGAGAPASAAIPNYRDPRAMLALEDFWRRWFAASNASLAEFGKPAPLVEIKWAASRHGGINPR